MKKIIITLLTTAVLSLSVFSVTVYASGDEDRELVQEYLINILEQEKSQGGENGEKEVIPSQGTGNQSVEKHSTIIGQTAGSTEITDNNVSTELIDRNVTDAPISDAKKGPMIRNSFVAQAYWKDMIPDEIIPDKLKGYITQAINSFTIFATIILVVALAAMGMGALDEQKLKFSKNAVKVLLVLILIANLLYPIIYLGLWMAGAV